MASPPWKLTLLACVALQGRACLGLRQQRDMSPVPGCLQKDHLSREITSTLAKGSLRKSFSPVRMGCAPVEFIDPPRRRDDMGELLRSRGLTGIGVEVGVQMGEYSSTLLEGWRQAALFIQVDLWEHQDNYADVANVNSSKQDRNMAQSCQAALEAKKAGLARQVVQCKDLSTACAKLIPDGALDFVYVDARHDRKGVLEDLAAYWPKVRVGGIIAGHDYMTQSEVGAVTASQQWDVNYDGTKDKTGQVVRGAVNDFFSGTFAGSPRDLKVCPRQPVITYREAWWNTWVVAK